MKRVTALIVSVLILLVAINQANALENAASRKLSFKGVFLSESEQTVLNNLQKIGFKLISSKSETHLKVFRGKQGKLYILSGPYFKGEITKIELCCLNGKVFSLMINDDNNEIFSAFVIKYGKPKEKPKKYNNFFKTDSYEWNDFEDGIIEKNIVISGKDYFEGPNKLIGASINFKTIHWLKVEQQLKQAEGTKLKKEIDEL